MKKTKKTEPAVAEQIDVEELLPQDDNSSAQDAPKAKRSYKKRERATLGTFMRGMGAMLAQATGAVFGEETPLTTDEGQMLQYVGDCAQEFGNSEELNEQLGKYGFYMLAGGFGVIVLSRLIPALKKRKRGLLPSASYSETSGSGQE